MRTHAGSHIEHSSPTTFERETLPFLEVFLTPKEERGRQLLSLTEIVLDRYSRAVIASVEANPRRRERRPCTRKTCAVDHEPSITHHRKLYMRCKRLLSPTLLLPRLSLEVAVGKLHHLAREQDQGDQIRQYHDTEGNIAELPREIE